MSGSVALTSSKPSSKHRNATSESKGNASVSSTLNFASSGTSQSHQLALSDQSRSVPRVPSTAHDSATMINWTSSIPKAVLVPSSVKNSAVAFSKISDSGSSAMGSRQTVLPKSDTASDSPKAQLHPLLAHGKMNSTQPRQREEHTASVNLNQLPVLTPPPTEAKAVVQTPVTNASFPLQGTKRRLGMGRMGGGYSNKKFKPPGS
ncbi:hypothetical protein H0H92_011386 [Tricholoma furcatifolium]|nr:hypothetical protein H0H92_011386 [Tricholoma furcatifolium]